MLILPAAFASCGPSGKNPSPAFRPEINAPQYPIKEYRIRSRVTFSISKFHHNRLKFDSRVGMLRSGMRLRPPEISGKSEPCSGKHNDEEQFGTKV